MIAFRNLVWSGLIICELDCLILEALREHINFVDDINMCSWLPGFRQRNSTWRRSASTSLFPPLSEIPHRQTADMGLKDTDQTNEVPLVCEMSDMLLPSPSAFDRRAARAPNPKDLLTSNPKSIATAMQLPSAIQLWVSPSMRRTYARDRKQRRNARIKQLS